ncbi:MAG: LicD family protein [Clostridia bacterium]|nr:LicD family protein [Clostridia bacterium]
MLDMKQVQDYIYEIFIEFDRVCQKHGLRYSMEGGTLLGAVKFGDFVPWDDDIDVIMVREDYEKFLKVAPKELDGKFFLQSFNSMKQFPLSYAKLCYDGTKICDYAYSHIKEMNHGVFMDIFPVDNVIPEKLDKQVRIIGLLTGARVIKLKVNFGIKGARLLVYKLVSLLPMKLIIKMINKACTKYNKYDTGYIYEVCNSNKKFKPCPSQMYKEYTKIKFRDGEFMAVKDYDKFLKSRFGENYMDEMPDEDKRIPSHHQTVVLTNEK